MNRGDVCLPRPEGLRLLRVGAGRGAHPRPPLGVSSWSASADAAVAVFLALPADWPASGFGDLTALASQIPPAPTLPEGKLVVVLGRADSEGGVVARLLRPRAKLPRAIRGSALLARGYVGIRAGADRASGEDLVWGYAVS